MLSANNYSLILTVVGPDNNPFIPEGMIDVTNNEIKVQFEGV
jgi:hypothetical protein